MTNRRWTPTGIERHAEWQLRAVGVTLGTSSALLVVVGNWLALGMLWIGGFLGYWSCFIAWTKSDEIQALYPEDDVFSGDEE